MHTTTNVDPSTLHEGSHKTFSKIYREELIKSVVRRITRKIDKLKKFVPPDVAETDMTLEIRANSETEKFIMQSLGLHTVGRATSLYNARQNAFDMEGNVAEVLDLINLVA